jgi:hypothetical protein
MKAVTLFGNGSGKYGAHVQVLSNLLRIGLLPLVVEYGGSCHDPKLWHLRQGVNQADGDALTKIIGVCIQTRVREWQNRDRINDRSLGVGS